MKKTIALFLALGFATLAQAQFVTNYLVNVSTFGGQTNLLREVSLRAEYWQASPSTFFINPVQTINVQTWPAITNGFVVFSNMVAGVPYAVTIGETWGNQQASWTTNFMAPTNAASVNGAVNAAAWVGQYVSPTNFMYPFPSSNSFTLGYPVAGSNGNAIVMSFGLDANGNATTNTPSGGTGFALGTPVLGSNGTNGANASALLTMDASGEAATNTSINAILAGSIPASLLPGALPSLSTYNGNVLTNLSATQVIAAELQSLPIGVTNYYDAMYNNVYTNLVNGASMYADTNFNIYTSGTFNGSGAGFTSLNPYQVMLSEQRLFAPGVLNYYDGNSNNVFTNIATAAYVVGDTNFNLKGTRNTSTTGTNAEAFEIATNLAASPGSGMVAFSMFGLTNAATGQGAWTDNGNALTNLNDTIVIAGTNAVVSSATNAATGQVTYTVSGTGTGGGGSSILFSNLPALMANVLPTIPTGFHCYCYNVVPNGTISFGLNPMPFIAAALTNSALTNIFMRFSCMNTNYAVQNTWAVNPYIETNSSTGAGEYSIGFSSTNSTTGNGTNFTWVTITNSIPYSILTNAQMITIRVQNSMGGTTNESWSFPIFGNQ